ncbi:hypothetical protein L7F22_044665 [Adiantum nelumboides]|nr:hypothetical protein [Adiantum nelumboides]
MPPALGAVRVEGSNGADLDRDGPRVSSFVSKHVVASAPRYFLSQGGQKLSAFTGISLLAVEATPNKVSESNHFNSRRQENLGACSRDASGIVLSIPSREFHFSVSGSANKPITPLDRLEATSLQNIYWSWRFSEEKSFLNLSRVRTTYNLRCLLSFNRMCMLRGTIMIDAQNVILASNSSLNTTTLAGFPPLQTSGTPLWLDGAGGGYGGRGAFCVTGDGKNQGDSWGGDGYSSSSLSAPWKYGSQGGITIKEEDLGGGGGGLQLDGAILTVEGYAGVDGGGGSGASILIKVFVLNGTEK